MGCGAGCGDGTDDGAREAPGEPGESLLKLKEKVEVSECERQKCVREKEKCVHAYVSVCVCNSSQTTPLTQYCTHIIFLRPFGCKKGDNVGNTSVKHAQKQNQNT